MIEILGYVMALVMGICLGLLGAGGSILTLPVLAYLFALEERVATAYSLFIVGVTAFFGVLKQYFNKNIDWNIAFLFGLPAVVSVWLVRRFVVPALPSVFFTVGDWVFTRRMGVFGLFAILMFWAAYSMLSNRKKSFQKKAVKPTSYYYFWVLSEGVFVGFLTGLVGAGGGFLIIPALVCWAGLETKKAIATSLVIIFIKSFFGFFLGDLIALSVDWYFLFQFSAWAFAGIFIGIFLSKFINAQRLRKIFAYFIILMAIFVFLMEFIFKK